MNWEIVPLGLICEVRTGKKDVNEGSKEGIYPFFTCAEKHTYSNEFSFDCEAILIAGNGAVGQVNYYKGKFEAYQRTYVLSKFKGVNPLYLLYVLKARLMNELSSKVLGNTIPYIKKGMLTDFQIPLPPLSMQQKIVEKLDDIFAEIDKAIVATEANIKNINLLIVAEFRAAFLELEKQHENVEIKNICKSLHQGLNAQGEKVVFQESGYPIIQTRNIQEGQIDVTENLKFLSKEDWDKYKSKYRPKLNDIFFTNRGTIGKTAIVTEEDDYLIHWNIFKLTPDTSIVIPQFLHLALNGLTKSGYFSKLQKGSTVSFVSTKMMCEAKIPLPSLQIQKVFVRRLDDITDNLKRLNNVYSHKMLELELIKESILKQALNGKLIKA